MKRVLSMGPRICMRVREKRTRRPVFLGWFQPPHWIDTTYFDKAEMLDPSRSDLPLMMKAVAIGLYASPRVDDWADYIQYTWMRTELGNRLFEEPRPKPVQERLDL